VTLSAEEEKTVMSVIDDFEKAKRQIEAWNREKSKIRQMLSELIPADKCSYGRVELSEFDLSIGLSDYAGYAPSIRIVKKKQQKVEDDPQEYPDSE
ncbi:MAG: hypothetical protein LBI64_01650, partial [Coriobacteriales bacterium]|nr:hypothetical protein [Coriobacteriales bacterium]